jgi:hypothetical protein
LIQESNSGIETSSDVFLDGEDDDFNPTHPSGDSHLTRTESLNSVQNENFDLDTADEPNVDNDDIRGRTQTTRERSASKRRESPHPKLEKRRNILQFPTKSGSLTAMFRMTTTSNKPLPTIYSDIVSVLERLGVSYHQVEGRLHCDRIMIVGFHQHLNEGPLAVRRLIASSGMDDGDLGEVNVTAWHWDQKLISPYDVRRGLRKIEVLVDFDIFIVKVPLLRVYGPQIKLSEAGPDNPHTVARRFAFKYMERNIIGGLRRLWAL